MTSSALSEMIRDKAEKQVADLRATKHWVSFDKRVRYTMNLLDSLVERHGGRLNVYMEPNMVYVSYDLYNLTGLKDPKLESLLYSLEHAEADETKTDDYMAAYHERKYIYKWNNPEDSGRYFRVVVGANFNEDSSTCKRVVVGYSSPQEPRPIYKLSCEGDEQQGEVA